MFLSESDSKEAGETTCEDFSCLEKNNFSKREVEVLGLLPLGYTNKQIASALGIKEVTVKKHLRNIANKLEAYGKTEILYKALQEKKRLKDS
ncbi:MAG: hypothetical protein Kow0090_10590 [Myxococcota bacterium]